MLITRNEDFAYDQDVRRQVDRGDLGRAVSQLSAGMGDETRRLPDVLHYLTRAIPDLHPLIALIERETGRKLTP